MGKVNIYCLQEIIALHDALFDIHKSEVYHFPLPVWYYTQKEEWIQQIRAEMTRGPGFSE